MLALPCCRCGGSDDVDYDGRKLGCCYLFGAGVMVAHQHPFYLLGCPTPPSTAQHHQDGDAAKRLPGGSFSGCLFSFTMYARLFLFARYMVCTP